MTVLKLVDRFYTAYAVALAMGRCPRIPGLGRVCRWLINRLVRYM